MEELRSWSCLCRHLHVAYPDSRIRHAPDVLLFIACHVAHDLDVQFFINCEYLLHGGIVMPHLMAFSHMPCMAARLAKEREL